MKTRIIFLFLLLLYAYPGFAAPPKFFSYSQDRTQKTEAYYNLVGSTLFQELKKSYPCAELLSEEDVKDLLYYEHQHAHLGTSTANALENIGEAMGSDYLIRVKVFATDNNMIFYDIWCVNSRTDKGMAHASGSGADGGPAIQTARTVGKELIEGLKEYEICPFKGPITVEISSELTEKKIDTYPVYCNGGDGLYRKESVTEKNSQKLWKLEKTDKRITGGSVSYNNREEISVEEQNDCYTCASGRQGPRMYTEKTVGVAKVEGLSDESMSEGHKIKDARTEIKFNSDGTYYLILEAASKLGDLTETVTVKAEGTCDNIKSPPKKNTRGADVKLEETFGPFPGTSLDKNLSQQNSITSIDPITKEKVTIHYDFNLTRE